MTSGFGVKERHARNRAARLFLGVIFLAVATPASAQPTVDPRWLPWIGAWTPVAENGAGQAGQPLLFIAPAEGGESVRLITPGVATQDVLTPNGKRGPVNRLGCQGSREMTWSSDGTRLFSRSDLTCNGQRRLLSGAMLFDRKRNLIDIQVVQANDQPGVWIQRYRPAGSLPPDILPQAEGARLAVLANWERARVSTGRLDPDDVIEGLQKVGSEAVEAMLVETEPRFSISSKLLARLTAAGAPDQILDLMVALSFPDRFIVEKGTVYRATYPDAGAIAPPVSAWDLYSWYYGFPMWSAAWRYPFFGLYDPWMFYPGYSYYGGYYTGYYG
ncbi:MAG: hypothetical protein EHM61_16030, partial [Acidobacteria bacterium]